MMHALRPRFAKPRPVWEPYFWGRGASTPRRAERRVLEVRERRCNAVRRCASASEIRFPNWTGFSIALFVATWLRPCVAQACPCGPDAGPAAALTRTGDRVALSIGLTWARETGTWDTHTRAWPQPLGARVDHGALDVALALRVGDAWEFSARSSLVARSVAHPGFGNQGLGLGDTFVRARWETPSASTPTSTPDVALWAQLRAPSALEGERALAWALPSSGLGAWELALGTQLRWRVASQVTLALALEAGTRTGGLGPRAVAAVAAQWLPTDRTALSATISEVWEVDAQHLGVFRRTTAAIGGAVQLSTRWRPSALIACDLRFDGLGRDASAWCRASIASTWTW
jgi:hypothetical protein